IRTVPDAEPQVLVVEGSNSVIDPYSACIIAAQRGEVYDICNKPVQPAPQLTSHVAPQPVAKPAIIAAAAPIRTMPHSFNFDTDNNFSTALEMAKKGDADAQYNLAKMYKDGNGVGRNYAEALKWMEKSASRGHSVAMMELAGMYKDGIGVQTNLELAYSWFNL